ncbi:coagulation factor X-like isoform X2 [Ascaphus truei]|uniref:coagulation factor X-like isoform X2 n=1 Tax=Ascaphus truei TaxID=8439 RepID=UPI003F591CFC
MANYQFGILLLINLSLVYAELSVFLKSENAKKVLRTKRSTSILWEMFKGDIWQAGLKSECFKEVCVYEEARELLKDPSVTNGFWKAYQAGKACPHDICPYGINCKIGINKNICLCPEEHKTSNCRSVQYPCGKIIRNHAQSHKSRKPPYEKKNASECLDGETVCSEAPTMDTRENSHTSEGNIISFSDAAFAQGRYCEPGECPWQALLVNEDNEQYCGGTILNEHFVLTAAHCINQTSFHVAVGQMNARFESRSTSIHWVDKILMHSKFQEHSYDYDIALIKLKEPIVFNEAVLPVCIPTRNFAEQILMSQDFGTVSFFSCGKEHDGKLQMHYAQQRDTSQCMKCNLNMTGNMFCASVNSTCDGEEGGPHVTPYKGTHFITGIASWSDRCNMQGQLAMYTKVSNFIDWIQASLCYYKNL